MTVDTEKECYEALGYIHGHDLFKPIPGKFKDYIALPKANMYQSLHTAVIGPYGEKIEIQIRTHEMHKVAEEGIAAHWKYKEGKVFDPKEDRMFAPLRQIIEQHEELKDDKEFLESVKIDLFPDEIYVFTPKGDVKELPKGATPSRFRLFGPFRPGPQVRGGEGERQARAAPDAPQKRGHHRYPDEPRP